MSLNHSSIFPNDGCFSFPPPKLGLPTAVGACMCNLCKLPQRIYEIYPRRSPSTSTPHSAGCRRMLHPTSACSHKKTQSSSLTRHQRAGISPAPAGTDRGNFAGGTPPWLNQPCFCMNNEQTLEFHCKSFKIFLDSFAATAPHSRGSCRFVFQLGCALTFGRRASGGWQLLQLDLQTHARGSLSSIRGEKSCLNADTKQGRRSDCCFRYLTCVLELLL